MMPQKRNPIALERIRALAGDAAGWQASQLGLLHLATSTDADQGYVHNRLPGYCVESAGVLALLREVIATIEVDVDRMHASAGRGWSTSSALADDLVRQHGLSYRAAHDVVARLVSAHEAAGADGTVDGGLVAASVPGYSAEALTHLLDPQAFVESRSSQGATSRTRRHELAELAARDLEIHQRDVDALTEALQRARARLLDDARSLVASAA